MPDIPITLDDLYELATSNQAILKELQAKTELVERLTSEVSTLKSKVERLERLEKDMKELQANVNDREQYAWSWSVRINGLHVSKEEEEKLGKDRAVMKKAYEKILKPILVAAKEEGALETVPSSYYNLLENGHKLAYTQRPGAKTAGPPAVIVRFSSRFMRNTVLRFKRRFMPTPTTAEVAAGAARYTIHEDLTKVNFRVLKTLIADSRFSKCWSVDGKIRFLLAGDSSNRVHVVDSIHMSPDQIYNGAKSPQK